MISLSDGPGSPTLSPDQALDRAARAHLGLKDTLPDLSFEDVHKAIASGSEPQLRAKAAASVDDKNTRQVWDKVVSGQPDEAQKAAKFAGQPTNPDTVLESRYSNAYMNSINWTTQEPDSHSSYKDAIRQVPELASSVVTDAQSLFAKGDIVRNLLQESQGSQKEQSTIGYGLDWAKMNVVPGYSQIKLRELGLMGSAMEKESQELYSLPTDQFYDAVKSKYDRISKDNSQLASYWLQAMLGQSTSEKVLNNIGTLADISMIPAAKGVRAVKALATSMVRGAAAVAEQGPAVVASATAGDLAGAGRLKATSTIVKAARGVSDPVGDAVEQMHSVMKTSASSIAENPGNFGQEAANRLMETYNKNADKLGELYSNTAKVETTKDFNPTPENMKKLQQDMKENYKLDNILDIGVPKKEEVSGNWLVDLRLGQSDATYFTSSESAEAWAKTKGIKDYQVVSAEDPEGKAIQPIDNPKANSLMKSINEKSRGLSSYASVPEEDRPLGLQKVIEDTKAAMKRDLDELKSITDPAGGNFYVRINRPVKSTNSIFRDVLGETEDTKVPNSFLNAAIGYARTPEETQTPFEMKNRKVLEYTPSVIKEYLKEVAEPVRKFMKKGKNLQDFERILNDSQKTGKWAENPLELDGRYQVLRRELPSNDEYKAYFTLKQVHEIDEVFRNQMERKLAVRRGAMSISLFMHDTDGRKINSDFFNAIRRDELRTGEGGVHVLGNKVGEDKVFNLGDVFPEELENQLRDDIKTGKKEVWEIDDPNRRQTNGFGKVTNRHNHKIRYVVGRNIEKKNLEWQQLPVKAGGNIEHDYDHYAVQANVRREGEGKNSFWHYEGDTPLFAHNNRLLTEDLLNKYNSVKDLIAVGDQDGAQKLFESLGLPNDFKDFASQFKPSRDSLGRYLSPRFNLKEPFMRVDSDKMSIEMPNNGIMSRNGGPSLFKDSTIQGNARNQGHYNLLNKRDAGDIFSVKNTGTRQNPVWALEPIRYVDPMTSMNRSMNSIINSLFMDDYKLAAVEGFLAQARPLMTDAGKIESKMAPTVAFRNPKWAPGADPSIKRQLEVQQFQINQFIGTPSKTDQLLHSWSQSLADSIYSKWNPDHYGPIVRTALLTPPWLLAHATDPIDFVRSFTFNATMGLFNPVHLFVWTMNYANIFGISGPSKALAGTFGAVLHQMSRFNRNPAILDYLDKLGSRMGAFKAGQWSEAMRGLEYTGFANMGHELSMLPHELSPKLFKSGYQTAMDFGQTFMRAADRNLRFGAWYTAYKEFRDVVPTGVLSNKDWIGILHRADMLAGNMSNASRSALQKGVLAFPTQFITYTLRQWELFTGKRLTGIERARLLTTYGVLFGLPGAAGLAIPFAGGESLRKAAIDRGYITGTNPATTTLMEGFLSQLGHLATDKYYDVGKRFGQYGLMSEDMLRDKPLWDIIGGASFSELSNIFASSSGFFNMVQSSIRGDGKFKPELQHFLDIATNIQAFNIVNRGIIAYYTSNWFSKNGSLLDTNISKSQAIIQSISGLTSQAQQDVSYKDWSLEDQRKAEKVAVQEFTKEWHRGLEAQRNNDPEQSTKYFQNAMYYLDVVGVPLEKRPDIYRVASKDWESVISRVDWEYYSVNRNIPTGSQQMRHDLYSKVRGQQ